MNGYENAVKVLPAHLRNKAMELPEGIRETVHEFRLRLDRVPMMTTVNGDIPLDVSGRVSREDLSRVVEIATKASPFAVEAAIRHGFVTASGGVRVGLCGRIRQGTERTWAAGGISSAAVRIPRDVRGCADGLCPVPFPSTLIISPPGAGKTTLLRDMVRQISDSGLRVGLCDERGEVAAMAEDGFGFDVGLRTDVLSDCPKEQAAFQLLRTMNPQVIAMDEITSEKDIEVCRTAAGCGASLLATAHSGSISELKHGRLYASLIQSGVFQRIIEIVLQSGGRRYLETST